MFHELIDVTVIPSELLVGEQPQVDLVDEGGGLESVVETLLAHVTPR